MLSALEQVEKDRHTREDAIVDKKKRGAYLNDEKTYRQEEWAALVLYYAERYKTTGEPEHGVKLLELWHSTTINDKCLPVRDALYRGEATSEDYIEVCIITLREMSDALIFLGVSSGIPLSFLQEEVLAFRSTQEKLFSSSRVLTDEEGIQQCASDKNLVREMFKKIESDYLIHGVLNDSDK